MCILYREFYLLEKFHGYERALQLFCLFGEKKYIMILLENTKDWIVSILREQSGFPGALGSLAGFASALSIQAQSANFKM